MALLAGGHGAYPRPVQLYQWVWRAPPGWPEPPAGWCPPPGWTPPPSWPSPPPGWQFWTVEPAPSSGLPYPAAPTSPPATAPEPFRVEVAEPSRKSVVRETWLLLVVFLVPAIGAAIVPLVQNAEGVNDINRFPVYVHGEPLTNMILGIVEYLGLGAVVPITLFLLNRTGQSASSLGLGVPRWRADIWPGLGLAAMSYGAELVVLLPFAPLLRHGSGAVNPPVIGHVPAYYVIYGLCVSAITAVTEEVMINGYLLVRLEQLEWDPRKALALSLLLRSSYHIYYGYAVLLLLPFGFFVTRSFQKHHRLNRPIMAHFIYDAVLITVSVVSS